MESVDCIVVGAGVIGLSVARAFAQAGHEVLMLEKAGQIGTGTSSRNSEVIHAGLYYPAGSLMARFCVEGRQALYDFCATHGVPARRCGKLIVATTDEEAGRLAAIAARAAANGVRDLERLSAAEAEAMEPALACRGALLSPSTGIVDSHSFMLALQGDAEAAGAMIAFGATVEQVTVVDGGFEVAVGGDAAVTLRCRYLINGAGLEAPALARSIRGLGAEHVPAAYYAKGNYFTLSGRSPFARLIYPVPVPGGLGVHLTLDLAGQARFGPDVEWVEGIDYAVDPRRADGFYAAIRRYWPGLRDGTLEPAYCGIRPKLVPAGGPAQDFVVQGPLDHGIEGLVNFFGIESPGLTASLPLADLALQLCARPAVPRRIYG